MELTTGTLLRRIVETDLSTSAHKLATLILDGMAWKEGYNGLERGTAAYTLAELARKMGVSRQYLFELLCELEASSLQLIRWKPHGRYSPWLFRFGCLDDASGTPGVMSPPDDTSLYSDSENKIVFVGMIDIREETNVHHTPWATLIKAAKTVLPCWNVDTQAIWDRFIAFNRTKGNASVPAGYLLGFMRKWRRSLSAPAKPTATSATTESLGSEEGELQRLIRAAPTTNRHFHAGDLCRKIGQAAYDARILSVMKQFACPKFSAVLAVHGRAVLAREIAR